MGYSTKIPVKWKLHYLDNQTKKYKILVGEEDTEAKALKVLWSEINNHKGDAFDAAITSKEGKIIPVSTISGKVKRG